MQMGSGAAMGSAESPSTADGVTAGVEKSDAAGDVAVAYFDVDLVGGLVLSSAFAISLPPLASRLHIPLSDR